MIYQISRGLSRNAPHIAKKIVGRSLIPHRQTDPMVLKITEDIRAELEAFVAKRKEEGGAPTDF